jgi:hypothetical protein
VTLITFVPVGLVTCPITTPLIFPKAAEKLMIIPTNPRNFKELAGNHVPNSSRVSISLRKTKPQNDRDGNPIAYHVIYQTIARIMHSKATLSTISSRKRVLLPCMSLSLWLWFLSRRV